MLADERSGDLRPSLTGRDFLQEIADMLHLRNPHYEAAMDYSIETDRRSVDEICIEIEKNLINQDSRCQGAKDSSEKQH